YRIGSRSQFPLRNVSTAVMISAAVTVVAAFWTYLRVMYQVGYESAHYDQLIVNAFGAEPWTRLHGWISHPLPADWGRGGGYIFGALFTFFLSIMRVRFWWLPLQPAGYVAAGSQGLLRLW